MFPQGEIMKLFVEIGFGAPLLLLLPLGKVGQPLGNPWEMEYPNTKCGEEAPCREPPLLRA